MAYESSEARKPVQAVSRGKTLRHWSGYEGGQPKWSDDSAYLHMKKEWRNVDNKFGKEKNTGRPNRGI